MSQHSKDLVQDEDYKPKNNWLLRVILALLLLLTIGFLIIFKLKP